jgi:ribosomal protein S27AE
MPETTNPVSSLLISYVCDECGQGGMVATGVTQEPWPAKYEHICDNCGAVAILAESYPRIDYEPEF